MSMAFESGEGLARAWAVPEPVAQEQVVAGPADPDEPRPRGGRGLEGDALDEREPADIRIAAGQLRGERDEQLVKQVVLDEVADQAWAALAQDQPRAVGRGDLQDASRVHGSAATRDLSIPDVRAWSGRSQPARTGVRRDDDDRHVRGGQAGMGQVDLA